MPTSLEFDKTFMIMAYDLAALSKCVSRKVGAIITKDNRIISCGYNGTVAGVPNCNELFRGRCQEHSEWSKLYEIHAELNALLTAAREGISIRGATLYTTTYPCDQCLKNLLQSGIIRIVYSEEYPESSQNEFTSLMIETAKVSITKITVGSHSDGN